ncbi:MAG: YARHG domain-containing protein [Candidatus Sericytochromatia bacterium]
MSKSFFSAVLLGSLLFAGLSPALAAIEYSGDLPAARQARPALQNLICSRQLFGGGVGCTVDAVRVLGDWAWVAWSGKEFGGVSVLRRSGKAWKHITGGGGVMIVANAVEAGVPRAIAEFLVPIYPQEGVAELKTLSAWELLVIRNMIYARHGRRFTTRRLQEYFETWPWYHPNAHYSDKLLSAKERQLIEVILKVEKQKGYL